MKKLYLLALSIFIGFSGATGTNPVANSTSKESVRASVPGMQKSGKGVITHSVNRISNPVSVSSAIGCIYTDDFNGANDTTSLQARGYKTYYRGEGPPGTTGSWFQGSSLTFASFNGPDTGYVASNFNSVTDSNDINNWLVFPAINLMSGDVFSFYSKSPAASGFVDSLHVWYSDAGDTVPEAVSWILLGSFEVNMLDLWELKSFVIPTSGATGRIAIQYAVVDGGPNGVNSNYVGVDQATVVRPSPADATIESFASPESGCQLSATEMVSVNIQNTGTDTIFGFDVSYTADSGTVVVESSTDTILPGTTHTYMFTATADLSALGNHTIDATVTANGDSNSCNDVLSTTIRNLALAPNPMTTAYRMGFEPSDDFSDWRIQDVNGDLATWEVTTATPHWGTQVMRKTGSGSNDNDWLITNCIDMTASSTYTLDYWYKNFELANPCSLEVFAGTTQDFSSMLQVLVQHPIPADTTYQHAILTFNVPADGSYYIGFHAFSFQGTGTSSLRLDDINIDNGTLSGIRKNVTNNLKVFPNPNTGVFNIQSRSFAGTAQVQVVNAAGQIVYNRENSNISMHTVDLSSFANGVYYIKVTTDSFVENHRVVVNR